MKVMSRELFAHVIDTIKLQLNFNIKCAEKMASIYPESSSANFIQRAYAVDTLIDVAEDAFQDKETEWIKHYIYELNFGEKSKELEVTMNGVPVPLETPNDLYDLLIDNIE